LCDDFDSNATYFIPTRPTPVTSTNNDYQNNNSNNSNNDNDNDNGDYDVNSSLTNNEYNQNNDLVFPAEPIALLASRGNCSFSCKAAVAESIHPSVQFLIMYNDDMEGDDALFSPAAADDEGTRLILVSVSHRTGQELRQYIAEQPEAVRQEQGGALIAMDTSLETIPGPSPDGPILTNDEWQLYVLMGFVGVICTLGCISRCFACCRQLGLMEAHSYSIDSQDNSSGPVFAAQTIPPATEDTRRKVAHVLQLPQVAATDKAAHFGDEGDNTTLICPICLDEELPKVFTVLPCLHRFHTECIIPWLTEQHASCPLCKYDMRHYVSDHEDASAV